MSLSILHCTYRPGGLKLLADCLDVQTDRDFELLVVDDCPSRWEVAYDYLYNSLGFKPHIRFCGPSKKQPFPDAKVGIANARNTALPNVRTSHLLFVDDYLWLPKTAIADWKKAIERHGPNAIITGVGRVYGASRPPDNFYPDGSLNYNHAWKDPQPTLRWKWDWIPDVYEGYSCVPMEFFHKTNGMDERADACTCFIPQSIVAQGGQLGYRFVVDKSIVCRMIDHRIWHVGELDLDGPWRINAYSFVPEEPVWKIPSQRSD